MKASLELQLGQQLRLTPQLQQAIQLLQFSSLELQTQIQQKLDSNPLLELEEELLRETASEETSPDTVTLDDKSIESTTNTAEDAIPEELAVDTAWEDIYQGMVPTRKSDGGDPVAIEMRDKTDQSLQTTLQWQMDLTPFSDLDRMIALAIIDSINDEGFFTGTLEDIASSLTTPEQSIEQDEIEAVLHRIQQFDPAGVGARDLRECLLIQLQQLPSNTPWRDEASSIVTEHLVLLARQDYQTLQKHYPLNEADFQAMLLLIQSLNPHPGSQVTETEDEYIIPDVFVIKRNDQWQVRLNEQIAPKLSINSTYSNMIKRANQSKDNNYLREQLQEARWFIKSLQSRNETLMKVASCIIKHQQQFLESGEEAMKPLVLRDIAQDISMHESTVSRITTGKYLLTPQGLFELKYFFSSHVNTQSGGECSATAIRAQIKKLIAAEEQNKPLSDNKIASLLKDTGINVARRTITKYREGLNIPSSNERKHPF